MNGPERSSGGRLCQVSRRGTGLHSALCTPGGTVIPSAPGGGTYLHRVRASRCNVSRAQSVIGAPYLFVF